MTRTLSRFVPRFRSSTNRRRTPAQKKTFDQAIGVTLETMERRTLLCALHQTTAPTELRPDLVGIDMPTGTGGQDGPSTAAPGDAEIFWQNRAQTSDGFSATFGANAETARRVMDAVIDAFERMIGSFNYGDGSTRFNLTVNMSGNHNGASASVTQSLGGKPKSGTVTMGKGSNGLGSGWFIDPTPEEHSEFTGNIVNAYSGDATSGSPAFNLGDFYTVAAAEVTHTLGLIGSQLSLWSSKTTNTGIADTAEAGSGNTSGFRGTFYVFRGPSIKHLLTSNNGGSGGSNFGSAVHGAGPGVNVNFQGDTYVGAQDIGNAVYEFSRRYIPSTTFSLMFKDAFSYSTVDPAQFGTFYSLRNGATKQVMVRGGAGDSADNITISTNGDTLTVSVDVGNDVAGTGALPGAGDLPAFVTHYNVADVSSLFIRAGEGNDTIDVQSLPDGVNVILQGEGGNDTINVARTVAGKVVSVTAGTGDDTITIGGGDLVANLLGTLNLDAGDGNDTLVFDDSATTADDVYTIDATGFSKTGSGNFEFNGAETVTLKANGGNNTINVNGTVAGRSIKVFAGGGDDTVLLGAGALDNLPALITIDGEDGTDIVTLEDSASTTQAHLYFVAATNITRGGFGGLVHANTETVRLVADAGNSAITVDSTLASVNLVLNGGDGLDVITVNETVAGGAVSIESSAGKDQVTVNDSTGTAEVRFVSPVTNLQSLNVRGGGLASLPAGGASVLITSALTVNGTLDLADNALILDYSGSSPINTVKTALASGYAAGAWNGTGINSSVAAADASRKQALGYAEASDLFTAFPATFAGQVVDDTAVLVRHTIYGDTNLDRTVNLSDFNRLAAAFGKAGRWSQGDLNYDDTVNLSDFNILATNFGASLTPSAAAGVLAPPTSNPVPAVDPVGSGGRRAGKA